MNPNARRAWVAALRSGRYEQGVGTLTRLDPDGGPTTHCCLGVLCELARADGVIADVRDHDGYRVYDDELNYLPPSVRDWAGLARCPTVRVDHREVLLATLNDGTDDWRRRDFAQLADLIEEQL